MHSVDYMTFDKMGTLTVTRRDVIHLGVPRKGIGAVINQHTLTRSAKSISMTWHCGSLRQAV